MKKRNEDDPGFLGGLGDLLPAEVLNKLNELLELMQQKGHLNQGSTVVNIYQPGSLHVDKVDNQYLGDKWGKIFQGKEPPESQTPPNVTFDDSTPLSVLFRENHHDELRKVIDSWRPYIISDDPNVDALTITRFEFDKKQIYSNRVCYDLLDLESLGALKVSLSDLARYLADHSNLSNSYATLYRQIKKFRQERP